MKLYVTLTTALVAAATCRAAEISIVSTSPNKQITIVEEREESGTKDYYFEQQPSRKKLGFALPVDLRGLSNVAVVASWNTTSTKVALLVSYGTKLNELVLFSETKNGTFLQVELRQPDPITVYCQHTGKTIPQPGDGYSQNAVGPWHDVDTVSLVSGDAKQTEQLDEYVHIFVTFRAHILGSRAEVTFNFLGRYQTRGAKSSRKNGVNGIFEHVSNESVKA